MRVFATDTTPGCIALQEHQQLGVPGRPFMACSLERCSDWCQQKYGRSVGSVGFGCQNIRGVETLAFCKCSDGGRTDLNFTREVLCHELLGCSACEHGYCSTSPRKAALFNWACVACEPDFALLPTGACVVANFSAAEGIFSCPLVNPCKNGGACIDGDPVGHTPFSCACLHGFEGPLCQTGIALIYYV